MSRIHTMVLCVVCVSMSGLRLSAQTPVSNALRLSTANFSRNLVEAAEEMPAEKYGFKPTPAQMSFADVVVHLAEGNDMMCGWISGTTAPAAPKVTATDAKDKLVARLRQSFDYCTSAFAKMGDTGLADSIPFFGRKMARADEMFAIAIDWADHYSQQAIYLRLNGLLPPTAKRKQG
ncbi:MAG TPA: DinB family protein [Gemmatimonadales bacterium]|nr:DinB family protein [Gemmatimonadales bacterium]